MKATLMPHISVPTVSNSNISDLLITTLLCRLKHTALRHLYYTYCVYVIADKNTHCFIAHRMHVVNDKITIVSSLRALTNTTHGDHIFNTIRLSLISIIFKIVRTQLIVRLSLDFNHIFKQL
jgi:hypothetical protein